MLIVTPYRVSVAGHRFVDRVVDDFVHQVMQAAQAGIADVHTRTFADVLQIAQMFELLGAVLAFDLAVFRHFASDVILFGRVRIVGRIGCGFVCHRTFACPFRGHA